MFFSTHLPVKNLLKAAAILGIGVSLAACSSTQTVPTVVTAASVNTVVPNTVNTIVPASSAVSAVATALVNAPAASNTKDACSILTARKLKTMLGIDITEGTPKPSNMNGSTCIFKSTNGTIIFQIGNGKYYYIGDLDKTLPTLGIGDKSYHTQGFDATTTNGAAGFVKGDVVVDLNISFKALITLDQLKALMQDIFTQV